MRNTATVQDRETERYEEAASLARDFLREYGLTNWEFGTFEDLVETFFGYILATADIGDIMPDNLDL